MARAQDASTKSAISRLVGHDEITAGGANGGAIIAAPAPIGNERAAGGRAPALWWTPTTGVGIPGTTPTGGGDSFSSVTACAVTRNGSREATHGIRIFLFFSIAES
jgi:hypothetical protein